MFDWSIPSTENALGRPYCEYNKSGVQPLRPPPPIRFFPQVPPLLANTGSTPPRTILNTGSTRPRYTGSTPPRTILNTGSTPPRYTGPTPPRTILNTGSTPPRYTGSTPPRCTSSSCVLPQDAFFPQVPPFRPPRVLRAGRNLFAAQRLVLGQGRGVRRGVCLGTAPSAGKRRGRSYVAAAAELFWRA